MQIHRTAATGVMKNSTLQARKKKKRRATAWDRQIRTFTQTRGQCKGGACCRNEEINVDAFKMARKREKRALKGTKVKKEKVRGASAVQETWEAHPVPFHERVRQGGWLMRGKSWSSEYSHSTAKELPHAAWTLALPPNSRRREDVELASPWPFNCHSEQNQSNNFKGPLKSKN